MKKPYLSLPAAVLACAVLTIATPSFADGVGTVSQAVNFFQNAKATGGQPFTVDAKGPVAINDDVELPGFAFQVYDIDFTTDSVTLKLIAQLEKLQVTLYDDTTFDRYYFAFDQEITSASLSDETDENFGATVELVAPGTTVKSSGSFVDGLPAEFTMDNGGILITIGEGTDLTKIIANGGSLTVNF